MTDDVRVAANWRREVTVAIARERVVALIVRAVGRTLHRPQRGVVDGVLARVAFHGLASDIEAQYVVTGPVAARTR